MRFSSIKEQYEKEMGRQYAPEIKIERTPSMQAYAEWEGLPDTTDENGV